MGTRHSQTVITKEGEVKIRQYGQWDGYPSGQGVNILRYLKTGNLKKYQKNLANIIEATEEDIAIVNADKDWKESYPHMSRDCGSKIHKLIEKGKVKFVNFIDESEANFWCEGFYTINFQTNEFSSEFHGKKTTYKLDNLPTEKKYLEDMKDENETL
jgi:hypothetical protein